jgi:CDP-diacylglycerol---serine O-phosphatidyltransferase
MAARTDPEMVDDNPESELKGFQWIPIRFLLPNLVTLLALCIGVTAIRLGLEQKYEYAVGAIAFAIVLDAIDGRLARYLEGTSKFGAELDSLADFVNFGVAPALLLYFWMLRDVRGFGWVACLLLAVACALRLARFNVMLESNDKPAWAANFFSGVPAPAGAGLALAPFYLSFLGMLPRERPVAIAVAISTVVIAALMVSRVPTFSGKSLTRINREWFLPVLALAAAFVICLISFPWETLLLVTAVYLVMIPFGIRSYRRHKQHDAMQ